MAISRHTPGPAHYSEEKRGQAREKKGGSLCNTTMMKLLAEHGVPYDRIRAVNLVNQFFLFRAADGLPVASNWVEAYLRLCDRALRQERNGLSLDIVRHLVGDCSNREHAQMLAQVRERY